jgi:hypothetical protein
MLLTLHSEVRRSYVALYLNIGWIKTGHVKGLLVFLLRNGDKLAMACERGQRRGAAQQLDNAYCRAEEKTAARDFPVRTTPKVD